MTRTQPSSQQNLPELLELAEFEAEIFAHPTRQSMAQSLAGSGELCFEGELLELPLRWHPNGTRH